MAGSASEDLGCARDVTRKGPSSRRQDLLVVDRSGDLHS
jgi:hypothetical protein